MRGPSACHPRQWIGAASPSSSGSKRRRAGFCAPPHPAASLSSCSETPTQAQARRGLRTGKFRRSSQQLLLTLMTSRRAGGCALAISAACLSSRSGRYKLRTWCRHANGACEHALSSFMGLR